MALHVRSAMGYQSILDSVRAVGQRSSPTPAASRITTAKYEGSGKSMRQKALSTLPRSISIGAKSPASGTCTPLETVSSRSSSWSAKDDETLICSRAEGLYWSQIAPRHFPSKSPNACRKRHERLMERQNAEQWDGVKLDMLAEAYMEVRREMWSLLAARVGEKWQLIEQKCMEKGLKNLNQAYRSAVKKQGTYDGQDDSGIVMSDLDEEADERYDKPKDAPKMHRDYNFREQRVPSIESILRPPISDQIYNAFGQHIPSLHSYAQGPPVQDELREIPLPRARSGTPTILSEDSEISRTGLIASTESGAESTRQSLRASQERSRASSINPSQGSSLTTVVEEDEEDVSSQELELSSAASLADDSEETEEGRPSPMINFLLHARQALLNQGVRNFTAWLYRSTGISTHASGPGSSSASGAGSSSASGSGSLSSTQGSKMAASGKRKRADGDDETGANDDDENPNKRPCRTDTASSAIRAKDLRLACPFFKRSPSRHMRGACSGPGWDTVRRVKAHIYRAHVLPLLCPRCETNVQDHQGLMQHLGASGTCSQTDESNPSCAPKDETDAIHPNQVEGLRRFTQRGRTECEKWRGVYMFLFPTVDEACVPSPFYDFAKTDLSFEDLCRQQLPAIMEKEMKRAVEEEIRAVGERLNNRIPELLRNAQRRFVEELRPISSAGPASTPDGPRQPLTPAQLSSGQGVSIRSPDDISSPLLPEGNAEIPADISYFELQQTQPAEPFVGGYSGYVSPNSAEKSCLPKLDKGKQPLNQEQQHPEMMQLDQSWVDAPSAVPPLTFAEDSNMQVPDFIDWAQGFGSGLMDIPEEPNWFT